MTKHTPGPWRTRYIKTLNPAIAAAESIVATVNSVNPQNPEERIANARLIAAAPDMLEALEVARAHVSPALQPNIYEMMDAAIDKAKGVTT